jgi:2-dehydro-3-deoxygalactonokinase
MKGAFIAIDWGTTNRRVHLIDPFGAVLRTERDDRGVLALRAENYPAEVAAIRARFGVLPILCAGMVGSRQGWREVPYAAAPTDVATLAAGLCWVMPDVAIVPGVSLVDGDRADVMRGEETQFLGAVLAGMVPDSALLCQPGTHCKWAEVAEGRLIRFTTAMTGELFALLRTHSLLSPQLDGDAVDGEAFRKGVTEAMSGDLLSLLFGARASWLLGYCARAGASYVSGLLIGADVQAHAPVGRDVYLLADGRLGDLYAAAIVASGGSCRQTDSHAAFAAGANAIWRACNAVA